MLSTDATRIYDGSAQPVTFTITGVNSADLSSHGALSFFTAGGTSIAAPRNVGSNYKVVGNFAGIDYNDDNVLEYGQLVDTTPIGTVVPIGSQWSARCSTCGRWAWKSSST